MYRDGRGLIHIPCNIVEIQKMLDLGLNLAAIAGKPVAACFHCLTCWSAERDGAEGSFRLFVPIILKGVCGSVSCPTPECLSYAYVHRFYAGLLPVLSAPVFVSTTAFLVYSYRSYWYWYWYTVQQECLVWFKIKLTRNEDI